MDLNVLEPIEGATSVSVYDVSARPGNLIAVAAVYVKETGTFPVSALLYFDFGGKLLAVYALDPSRAIRFLALDERSHLWTLTTSAGDQDPAEAPLIVEYDQKGRPVRELLTRDAFPLHAEMIEESPEIGAAALGYDSGVLWF
jgi:hypothetical protein